MPEMAQKAQCGSGMQPLHRVVSETIVINPAHFTERREASQKLCDKIGLSNVRFSDGVSGLPHHLACALAHRKALWSISSFPSLVLEDDLQLTDGSVDVPTLPADADIVYLSVTPFGCLPWTYENLALARHRAIEGLTLASRHNEDWLRIHSMSGGQAILYVTERGRDAWKQATLFSKRFGAPFDVFTAYAMKDLKVYAPHTPLLSEDGGLQRGPLRENERLFKKRLSFTRAPVIQRQAGDRTTVHFKGQQITVEAVQTRTTSLQWSVINVERGSTP